MGLEKERDDARQHVLENRFRYGFQTTRPPSSEIDRVWLALIPRWRIDRKPDRGVRSSREAARKDIRVESFADSDYSS
jgi:hypothetical protein